MILQGARRHEAATQRRVGKVNVADSLEPSELGPSSPLHRILSCKSCPLHPVRELEDRVARCLGSVRVSRPGRSVPNRDYWPVTHNKGRRTDRIL